VYAALAAIRLLREVGLAAVREHVLALGDELIAGLRRRGLAVMTPEDRSQRGALVMVRCRDARRLVARLAERGVLCSTRDAALRVSLHYYNSTDDLRALLSGLDENLDLLTPTPPIPRREGGRRAAGAA